LQPNKAFDKNTVTNRKTKENEKMTIEKGITKDLETKQKRTRKNGLRTSFKRVSTLENFSP